MLSVLSMHPTAATVKVKLELPSGAWPPRPSSPHATLVVVPGMSQTAAVAQNVVRNVRRMGDHPFSCVVFLYEPAQIISLGNSTSATQVEHAGCSVVRWVGRNIIDYLKLLDADVTRGFGGGVLVCLDDDVVQFALPPFLCTARRLQLDVASPAIMGEATRPSWGLMQRREYAGAARIVTIVEIHVTYFSPRAWACYQELLDPILNWGGYGYDIWLQNYMVDHCALREPRMGILDGYTAIHAHQWFRKEAGQQLWLATRAHNGSRLYQMDNMYDTMRQRGTPVRHAPESISSRVSPRNESILQLHNKLCNKYNRALNVSLLERGVQLAADDALLVRGAENALLVGAELRERHRAARARGGGRGVRGL